MIKLIGFPIVFGTWSRPMRKKGLRHPFIERIALGAIPNWIGRDNITLTANHDPKAILASTKDGTLKLTLTPVGLFAAALVREAPVELLRPGGSFDVSFTFQCIKDAWSKKGATLGRRTIKKLVLYELAIASDPLYPASFLRCLD